MTPCLYLVLGLGVEADEYEGGEGHEVHEEGRRVGEPEGDAQAARQHDEDGPGAQHGAHEHHDLVDDQLKSVFPEVPTNRSLGRLNLDFKGLLYGKTCEVFLEDLGVSV